jgi:hypothetical protein
MSRIEILRYDELDPRQKLAHNFVIIFAAIAIFIGINLRDSTLNATWIYTNSEAGIRAEYPQRWLIDTQGDYVFRVRDVSHPGYATTIQVSVQPVGANTPARYIFDALTLMRSQTLAFYSVLSSAKPFVLPDESPANITDYTFAAGETDPFVETIPVIVRGQDILTIKRGQAIIITFLTEASDYKQTYPIFERFINNLEF